MEQVSGRDVVDALESHGVKFTLDKTEHGFNVEAPKDFDQQDLLVLMNRHAEEVGKYLLARDEHVGRLLVVDTSRTKH